MGELRMLSMKVPIGEVGLKVSIAVFIATQEPVAISLLISARAKNTQKAGRATLVKV
jgi:hypothetical protein